MQTGRLLDSILRWSALLLNVNVVGAIHAGDHRKQREPEAQPAKLRSIFDLTDARARTLEHGREELIEWNERVRVREMVDGVGVEEAGHDGKATQNPEGQSDLPG